MMTLGEILQIVFTHCQNLSQFFCRCFTCLGQKKLSVILLQLFEKATNFTSVFRCI